MTDNPSPALQRAGPLAKLPGLLADMGVSADSVFAPFGIDPAELRADSFLRFGDGLAVLQAAAETARCDHLGLLLGSRFALDDYEPMAGLMRSAPTLHDAILDQVTWQPRFSNGAAAYLHRTRDVWCWGYGIYDRTSIGNTHLYDLGITAAVRMLDELSGGAVRPLEIHLCHRASKPAVFEKILKAPVSFNQTQACVVLGDDALAYRPRTQDPVRRAASLAALDTVLCDRVPLVSDRVKHYIRPLVLRRDASLSGVAAQMKIHPRTLRRYLRKEGRTFEQLFAEVRCAMACELLAMTDVPLSEVSDALDYSMQSSFTHAFKRWTGLTPYIWREQAGAGPSAPPASAIPG